MSERQAVLEDRHAKARRVIKEAHAEGLKVVQRMEQSRDPGGYYNVSVTALTNELLMIWEGAARSAYDILLDESAGGEK